MKGAPVRAKGAPVGAKVQCLCYKILPSRLCAEIWCKRGKKGLSGRIGTFSGADQDLSSLFTPKCGIA